MNCWRKNNALTIGPILAILTDVEDVMKFRDLQIGDTFDFIGPDNMLNSFYSRCTKISSRKYRWENPIQCSLSPAKYLETRVGSINVEVYHVEKAQ
jgi:hypothetical protein